MLRGAVATEPDQDGRPSAKRPPLLCDLRELLDARRLVETVQLGHTSQDARLVSMKLRIEELRGEGILSAAGAERLLRGITAESYLRLIPGLFECDGFFVAMIEKSV